MIQYDARDSIIFWVVTTAHALERAINEELAPLGMTFRQAEVLAWLALEGELSQTEMAERMRIEAPTLAGIVDRMERAGWVQRTACPDDRRKKRLRPTERVEPVWEKALEAGARIRRTAGDGFSPEQIREVMASLEKIQENLKSLAEAAEQPPPRAPKLKRVKAT